AGRRFHERSARALSARALVRVAGGPEPGFRPFGAKRAVLPLEFRPFGANDADGVCGAALLEVGERHLLAGGQPPRAARSICARGGRHVGVVAADGDRQVTESRAARMGWIEWPGDRVAAALV